MLEIHIRRLASVWLSYIGFYILLDKHMIKKSYILGTVDLHVSV